MHIQEAEAFLLALPRFADAGAGAFKPGLERIERLLAAMGDPHRAFRSIHVAGTNGKGSTASMVAAIASAAGYRVGLHTSPHLLRLAERMRVDGVPASDAWLAGAVERFRTPLAALEPSFFEATVALSFRLFADAAVDWAVVEVGLGGRLDATNVLRPEAALITSIGLDHTDVLGPTLAAIAQEKAGIIKPGVPVLTSVTAGEPLSVLRSVAAARAAPLHEVGAEVDVSDVEEALEGLRFTLQTPHRSYPGLWLDLPGRHQIENAALAVRAAELTLAPVLGASDAVYRGLGGVRARAGLRGRLEVLASSPLVLVDVAHNAEGIERACAYARAQAEARGGRLHVALGLMRDKAADAVARRLCHVAPEAGVFALDMPSPRAWSASDLCRLLREQGVRVTGSGQVVEVAERSSRGAASADVLLFVGSHQVVAAALVWKGEG